MPAMGLLRPILLAMAGSSTWKRLLTGLPVTRRVVGRFIPGESLDAALGAVAALGAGGFRATMNPLGENVRDRAEAAAAAATYVEILEAIAARELDANVSVKLTMLGLDLGPEIALENLSRVVATAERHHRTVRIDMESSAYVDPTLEIWRRVHAAHPGVGVVIQSYLRRSLQDVERLVADGASIRVVKGAYSEPRDAAFPDKADVDRNFIRILDRLARADARDAGVQVAVASHDPAMLEHGRNLIDAGGLAGWEFQMLYGIGREHQRRLREQGYPVRVYVSYGPSWYPWFMRRLAERPANLLFFIRHLLG